MILLSVQLSGRDFKNLVKKWLLSGMVNRIDRINYGKSYIASSDKKIVQGESKIVLVSCVSDQQERFLLDITKNTALTILVRDLAGESI